MDHLTQQVLLSFSHLGRETLDLHQLFEAGGNDPQARTIVLDIVERLVREGLLEEKGGDFYSLTTAGAEKASRIKEEDP